jgi:hypothetical protein
MGIKGTILKNRIQNNKYQLTAQPGLIPITFTGVSGIEEELDTTELPDRTVASGGRTKPVEFEVRQPLHHKAEVAAMEAWFKEGQDPQAPTYQKVGTLIMFNESGAPASKFTLIDLFVYKRTMPDLELESDGDMAEVVWGMKANQVLTV